MFKSYACVVFSGFQSMARIPPMIPRSRPIPIPPMQPSMLVTEKTMISAPHNSCCIGFTYNMTAATITIMPKTMPTIPIV